MRFQLNAYTLLTYFSLQCISFPGFSSIIKNPGDAEYLEVIAAGEAATWPFFSRIKAHCHVEMTLDRWRYLPTSTSTLTSLSVSISRLWPQYCFSLFLITPPILFSSYISSPLLPSPSILLQMCSASASIDSNWRRRRLRGSQREQVLGPQIPQIIFFRFNIFDTFHSNSTVWLYVTEECRGVTYI